MCFSITLGLAREHTMLGQQHLEEDVTKND